MNIERAISRYGNLLEAWNRQDAAAFSSVFAEDGSTVGFDGSPLNGREAIASTLGSIFRGHRTATYVAKLREVRPLAENVLLVRAVAGMVPPGTDHLNPALHAIQSLVFVFDGDSPHLALFHNTPAAFHGRPEEVDALTVELDAVLQSGQLVAE
jgi:uncharacterized protein (TIGR02246 family)